MAVQIGSNSKAEMPDTLGDIVRAFHSRRGGVAVGALILKGGPIAGLPKFVHTRYLVHEAERSADRPATAKVTLPQLTQAL